jgi:hypothetical protein
MRMSIMMGNPVQDQVYAEVIIVPRTGSAR